ncbi:hypothetical protein O181_076480 [Austropuccinia psidii MF-1]|uniref:Uncharacterized protein n=1 Tax=Austropuccinia psidii MF-1 TaxID=1389203 RepID=A0A9Q3FGB2_9BASI|nr:hypothetical protein [Austropuccinia psidii MF-1]
MWSPDKNLHPVLVKTAQMLEDNFIPLDSKSQRNSTVTPSETEDVLKAEGKRNSKILVTAKKQKPITTSRTVTGALMEERGPGTQETRTHLEGSKRERNNKDLISLRKKNGKDKYSKDKRKEQEAKGQEANQLNLQFTVSTYQKRNGISKGYDHQYPLTGKEEKEKGC